MKVYILDRTLDFGFGDETSLKPLIFKDLKKALQYMEELIDEEYKESKKAVEEGEDVFIFRHSDILREIRKPGCRVWFSIEEHEVIE